MRIALVSPYALDAHGGVQTQVLGLAAELAKIDQVEIVAPGHQSVLPGVAVHSVGATVAIAVNGSRAPIALDPRAWGRTRAALRAFRPDVLHIHEPFVPLTGVAAVLSGAAPIVATFHRAGRGRIYSRLGTVLDPLAARLDVRVAVSEEAAATVAEVLGTDLGPVEILPNGVDLERFSSRVAHVGTRPVVCFVGRFEERKGLQVLLEAFGGLEEAAELWVIGSGSDGAGLRAAGRSSVQFLGALDDEEMTRRLCAADVFVAPSLGGESFGVVLLEAMAARCAVVASDLPGYRLAAGDAARFAPPGDVAALRSALGELIASMALRSELVERGRVRVERYSFAQLAEGYRALYTQAIRSRTVKRSPRRH